MKKQDLVYCCSCGIDHKKAGERDNEDYSFLEDYRHPPSWYCSIDCFYYENPEEYVDGFKPIQD